jgi:hypothetical protein
MGRRQFVGMARVGAVALKIFKGPSYVFSGAVPCDKLVGLQEWFDINSPPVTVATMKGLIPPMRPENYSITVTTGPFGRIWPEPIVNVTITDDTLAVAFKLAWGVE